MGEGRKVIGGIFFYVIGIERAFPEDCKKAFGACAWLLRMAAISLVTLFIFSMALWSGRNGCSEGILMAFYTYLFSRFDHRRQKWQRDSCKSMQFFVLVCFARPVTWNHDYI